MGGLGIGQFGGRGEDESWEGGVEYGDDGMEHQELVSRVVV